LRSYPYFEGQSRAGRHFRKVQDVRYAELLEGYWLSENPVEIAFTAEGALSLIDQDNYHEREDASRFEE